MTKTKIFVSSTCFDLAQIRRDLEDFIKGLGHEPVMSDSSQIAIPPGLSNLEVCKYLVSMSDVFVLIIGGRYGSEIQDSGKSITNIEYDTAYELEMPIYSFVDLGVWNKRDSFEPLKNLLDTNQISEEKVMEILGPKVEDLRIFEFINRVAHAERDQWIFQFREANDIKEILRNNLSLLFHDLLSKRRSNKINELDHSIKYQPKLELTVQTHDRRGEKTGDESNEIIVKPRSKLVKKDITQSLKEVRPSESDISLLQNRLDDIEQLLNTKTAEQIGLSTKPENASELIESVSGYALEIDQLIELAENDFDYFEKHNGLGKRSVLIDFSIHNHGTKPAEAITIYLEPSDKIIFMNQDDLLSKNFSIPTTRPKKIHEILNLLNRIDDLLLNNPDQSHSEIYSPPKRPSYLTSNPMSSLYGPTFNHQSLNPNAPYISLKDGNIVITLNKLSHNFVITVKNNDIYLCPLIGSGEETTINYTCYADNLPVPNTGTLTIISK